MNRRLTCSVWLALGLGFAGVAHAQERRVPTLYPYPAGYLGASVTYSDLGRPFAFVSDGSITSVSFDDDGKGYRIFGALDFRHVALEVGYADVGDARAVSQSDGSRAFFAAGPQSETQGYRVFDASLIGRVPLGEHWAAVARIGINMMATHSAYAWNTQADGPTRFHRTSNSSAPLYGAGVEYRGAGQWRLIAEYRATEFEDPIFGVADDAGTLSLAIAHAWRGRMVR